MKTYLQIVSDVHLEFYHPKRPPVLPVHAENLALLGDIGKPFDKHYESFLEKQSKQFQNVFVLLGNHEAYDPLHSIEETTEKVRFICMKFSNVHLLDRATYDLTEDTVLLGCTLWSNIKEQAVSGLNDFNRITTLDSLGKPVRRNIVKEDYIAWFHRDLHWLEQTIDKYVNQKKNLVVLTHHGPLKVMSGKYMGNKLDSGFTTALDYLFKPPVIAFANGHVHCNNDVTVNGIRCVSNAIGYPGEKTGYRKDVVLEIP